MDQVDHLVRAVDDAPLLLRFRPPGGVCDDRHHPSLKADGSVALEDAERVLWRGRTNVAEYLYSEAMDRRGLRYVLPAIADVVITDRRLAFVCRRWQAPPGAGLIGRALAAVRGGGVVAAGQVRWQWPSLLYVKRDVLLLVVGAYRVRGLPTLVLTGWRTDPRDVANVIRVAVARFRLDRAAMLDIDAEEAAALTERISAPVFVAGASHTSNLPGPLLFGFLTAAEYRLPEAASLAIPSA